MSQLVYTKILLNGNPILTGSSYSINLHQAMAQHQTLKITCPTDAIENPLGNFADKAKTYIGKRIALQVAVAGGIPNQITRPDLKFMGVVTNVSVNKFDGADGSLTITAHSPTVLLSHGQDSQSYENKTLTNIIKEATKEYPQNTVKIRASPLFQDMIPYTVQYKESDFDFIKRLAMRYGEWLYYDGEQLRFGIAGGQGATLLYGQDLHNFNFSMQTRPQDHTYIAYDALEATLHSASMSEYQKRIPNPYIKHVTDVSRKLYAKKPQSIYNHSLFHNGVGELNDVVRLKAGQAINTILFTGHSEVPSVAIAQAVTVKGLKAELPGQTEFYGKYIVTEITHTINSSGEYENHFSGVPRDVKVPPYYNENAIPYCEEQYAVVKDNNDPMGMSRIRVQFPWQVPTNQLSPWIRVTTPYAGKGKGMHILPELEEEVLVSFEGGCAEKPVVIGTMFNGAETSGHGGAGNFIKGLQTAAGQRLQMNDKDGSMYLQDNGNASMKFDGAGNTVIKSKNSKNIDVGNNSSTLKMNKDGIIDLSGNGKIIIKVGNSSIELTSDKVFIKGINIEVEGKNIKKTASKIELNGEGSWSGGNVIIN